MAFPMTKLLEVVRPTADGLRFDMSSASVTSSESPSLLQAVLGLAASCRH